MPFMSSTFDSHNLIKKHKLVECSSVRPLYVHVKPVTLQNKAMATATLNK